MLAGACGSVSPARYTGMTFMKRGEVAYER
jgi:hypothetical protein